MGLFVRVNAPDLQEKIAAVTKQVEEASDEVTAVQYREGEALPKGVELREVTVKETTFDHVTGKPEVSERVETRAYVATKDPNGDHEVKEALSSVGDGCWIVTHKDGTVSICHPLRFEEQYIKRGK